MYDHGYLQYAKYCIEGKMTCFKKKIIYRDQSAKIFMKYCINLEIKLFIQKQKFNRFSFVF